MKKIIFVILFLTVTGIVQAQITTFVLVRHGEKANENPRDPELSEAGKQRAEKFAALFAKAKVDAVLSTNYKRTRNTVMPLAVAHGLTVETYSAMKQSELEALQKKYTGGTIILAGHSNTIPVIANALVGENRFEQFDDADYGNVLIIAVTSVGKDAQVVWLRY